MSTFRDDHLYPNLTDSALLVMPPMMETTQTWRERLRTSETVRPHDDPSMFNLDIFLQLRQDTAMCSDLVSARCLSCCASGLVPRLMECTYWEAGRTFDYRATLSR